jgi:Ser/Thr protein kinase RdoA (MazF antagonist)
MTNFSNEAILREFLARRYSTEVLDLTPLAHGDKQVYRLKQPASVDWVVRVYPPLWQENVAAMVEVFQFLEQQCYPAERVILARDGSPVVQYGEDLVLVTTFLGPSLQAWQPETGQPLADDRTAPRVDAPTAFFAIGAALARLHRLPVDQEPSLRRARMLPRRELSWVAGLLAEIADRVPAHLQAQYADLVAAIQQTNFCEDAPSTLIHNDPNLGNVVQRPAGELVLIDWEMAGLGPAVVDVGILLRNSYAMAAERVDEATVHAVVDGYCQHRPLTPLELERLPAAIRFMTLVLLAACFPDRMNGTLHDDDLLYGATYATWQRQYAATDQIAALARRRFAAYDPGNAQ